MKERYASLIETTIREHTRLVDTFFEDNNDSLLKLCNEIVRSLRNGRKILIFGNGGSAADAQHIAAEFVNRLKRKRKAIPAIALTTDSSIITSIANDYSFDSIFLRQIEALGNRGDIALGISTSGRSRNVYLGLKTALSMGLKTAALLGYDGGTVRNVASVSLIVKSRDAQRIQEVHGIIGHLLCLIVENEIFRE